jgi:prepilin-type N-terminal cleavage/methylation domain-containing protein
MKNKNGFSLLELVVAIFLLAITLGVGILIIAQHLNVIKKANEIMIATTLTQYAIEDARNMDFPPVYYDRLLSEITSPYGSAEFVSVVPSNPSSSPGRNMTPPGFQNNYIVYRYIIAYNSSGVSFQLTSANYDNGSSPAGPTNLQIIVYVLRAANPSYIILTTTTYMSRNGLF